LTQLKAVVETCTKMVNQKAEDCGSGVLNLSANASQEATPG